MYKTNNLNLILNFFQNNPLEVIPSLKILEEFKGQMNKATIYRKLQSLEKEKIIRKNYNVEKGCYEYQYSIKNENQLHLICKACGKIIPLECSSAKKFVNHIFTEHDFLMDQGETMIIGVCKECNSHA